MGFAADGKGGCDPVLPPAPCATGQIAVPGDAMCRDVAPCADGPWGDIAVDAATIYVDAAYAGGSSDGSKAKPWTTVQAAIDAAPSGGLVAIAAGSYLEDLLIEGKAVRLWGRCPSLVELRGTGAEIAAVHVRAGATGTELHTLAVGGAAAGVAITGSESIVLDRLWAHDLPSRGVNIENTLGKTSTTIESCLIESCTDDGVYIAGSEVNVQSSVVRGTRARTDNVAFGIEAGVTGAARSKLSVSASVLENNAGISLGVHSSDATLEASVVRDTQLATTPMGSYGWGIAADSLTTAAGRGQLVVRSSVLERNLDRGVAIGGADADLEATVIRDTASIGSDPMRATGLGIIAQSVGANRASALVRGCDAERNAEFGAIASGADITIESTILRENGVVIEQDEASGLPSTGAIRSTLIEDAMKVGVIASATDATIDATLVRRANASSDGRFGDGISAVGDAAHPATVAIHESRVEASARAGISSFGASVSVASSTLECNAIDIAAQPVGDAQASFADGGANVCGCQSATLACAASPTMLEAPSPVPIGAP